MSVWALGLVLVVSRPVCTKYPDPMAGQPLDPDKPICFMPCQGVEADPKISRLFCGFLSPTLRLLKLTLIIQSQGRPTVEHLHKIVFETHKTLPRIFLHFSHIFLKLGNGKPQTKLDII